MANKVIATADFGFTRSTKNTHRFDEIVEDGKTAIIGSLYLQKSAAATAPAKVQVTIKEV